MASEDATEIIGRWKFTEYIYNGQTLPLPNPKLQLFFEFNQTGSNRLWWTRDNEPGFCERIGLYNFDGDTLEDQVVWVNPNNHIECAKHEDMIMGQIAKNKVTIIGNKLHLHLALKGEPFVYVWEKQSL